MCKQERERYRVNLVPVENQLSSGQVVEQEQRSLQASTAERFEAEENLEYVELEEQRREPQVQRRYLDEPSIDPYADRYETDRYEADRYSPEPDPIQRRGPAPASRRPVQQPGAPLDVEPMQRPNPLGDDGRGRDDQDLDDPW